MKEYRNGVYPVSLVVAFSAQEVNKEFFNALEDRFKEVAVNEQAAATTLYLTRRNGDAPEMAVGIIFKHKNPGIEVQAHEAFHATRNMIEFGCHVYLDDQSEEAWAYLHGWIMSCINDFLLSSKTNINL